MSVVIETTVGDITVDLYLNDRPRASLNFMKLCKMKYYNYNLFHTISRGFIAQTGDPTGSRTGGESIFGVLDGPTKRYFEGENEPRIKHTKMGLISFVGNDDRMIGSQFFLTLGDDLTYLDEKHCVFGEVVEGFDILEMINEVICDTNDRPYQDVRITHTVILDDPFPDPKKLLVPSRSPSPSAERLQGGRIAPDEEIDELEGKTAEEVVEMQAEREAKARATILEMVGDLPDADMAPPENVLFVCKLNPVTNDDDLEIIFSRFGKIKSCEVIRDKKTGDSLQYAFVEFETQKSCEDAYFKMDNVLIDDRRIHVDFSQSVSKVKWHGKGRGVTHYDEKGQKSRTNNNIGKGDYKSKNDYNKNRKDAGRDDKYKQRSMDRSNSTSPRRRRNFSSPKRSESQKDRGRRSSRERERSSRKDREPSSSSRKRDIPSKNYRESPSSSQKHAYKSRTDRNGRKVSDRRSRSNEKRSSRYDTSTNRSRGDDRMIEKERLKEKRYSEERMRNDLKKKSKKRSYSESEDENRRHKDKKKKSKHASEDSDSDRDKKKSKKKVSSDSSDSDCKTKKKRKKKRSSRRDSSDSDSDHYKNKKSKKKKKRYDDDSD